MACIGEFCAAFFLQIWGGDFALASPHSKFWGGTRPPVGDSSPCAPVIDAHRPKLSTLQCKNVSVRALICRSLNVTRGPASSSAGHQAAAGS